MTRRCRKVERLLSFPSDKFLVYSLDPDGRLLQERIPLKGKPSKRLADRRASQITAELTLGTYESKAKETWKALREEFEKALTASNRRAGTKDEYRETLNLFEIW